MKKVRKLLVLALLFGLLTGCKMREEIGFNIDKNQKLSLRFVYAMDDEMIDEMIKSKDSNLANEEETTEEETPSTTENVEAPSTTEDAETPSTTEDAETEVSEKEITDEMRWEYLKESASEDYGEDAKYEKYEVDGFKGYIVTKELGNLENFVANEESERTSITGNDLESKKFFVKTANGYKSIMKLDKSSGDMSSISQYQQMGALFDIKFVMTLPNKSISNNATSVSEDGLTLTWNLLTLTDENIDFEFKIESVTPKKDEATSSNLMLYLGIGGLILLIAIILLIIFSKKKDKNIDNIPSNDSKDNEFISAIQNNNESINEQSNIYNENVFEQSNTYNENDVAVTEPDSEPIVNNESIENNNIENNLLDKQDNVDDIVKVEPFDEN